MKICSSCNKIKNKECFYKTSTMCKPCRRDYYKAYYKQNKNQIKKTQKKYAKENKEKLKQIYKNWHIKWRKHNPNKYLWRAAKSRSLKSGCEFTIKPEDLKLPDICPVLGIKLDYQNYGRQSDNSASVDRIDNYKGYTPDNVVVISWRANYLKNNATLEELKKLVNFYKALECQI